MTQLIAEANQKATALMIRPMLSTLPRFQPQVESEHRLRLWIAVGTGMSPYAPPVSGLGAFDT